MTDVSLIEALNKASALHQAGRLDAARARYRAVLAINPEHPEALTNLGALLCQQGDVVQGLDLLDRSLCINASQPNAFYNRANALADLGRDEEAIASYGRAIALKPDYPAALFNQGAALARVKRYERAVRAYSRCIELAPNDTDAFNNLGLVLAELGHYDEALANYERATDLKPDYAAAYFNQGLALTSVKRYEQAVVAYSRYVELAPNDTDAFNNLGLVLAELGRYDEALAHYEHAVALKPDVADVYCNQGAALVELRRHKEALASYERAVKLRCDFAEAHFGAAVHQLRLGDYERGWKSYEWRWARKQCSERSLVDAKDRLWLGKESIAGQTLLLRAEQGLGDTIQFCRYARMAHDQGATIILEVPEPLLSLFATLETPCHLICKGMPLPPFDRHCPLLSLPLAFNTTMQTIPADVPYLGIDPRRLAQWRDRLGPPCKPRVGIVTSGNPANSNDHRRSIDLERFQPLFSFDVEFHCLHQSVLPADEVVLRRFPEIGVHSSELRDFADTAALISELDLVIAVDTAVAHLAGALGKPVWIMLPYTADFRWLLDREDSPWYPTARLFRQSRRGDWETVIERVTRACEVLFGCVNAPTCR